MFSHLCSRLFPSRVIPSFLPTATRPTTRVVFAFQHQTRCLHPSVTWWDSVAEKDTTKNEVEKATNKDSTSRKSVKANTNASAKRKVGVKVDPKKKTKTANASEEKPVEIPPEYKHIPGYGVTNFTHWFSKYYLPSLPARPSSLEGMKECSTRAGKEYKLMSEEEKLKVGEEVRQIREKRAKERQEFINGIPYAVLKEINKQRAKAGKSQLRKHKLLVKKRPPFPFSLFASEFCKSKPSEKGMFKLAAESWRKLSDVEKEPYYRASREAWVEYRASHTTSTEDS